MRFVISMLCPTSCVYRQKVLFDLYFLHQNETEWVDQFIIVCNMTKAAGNRGGWGKSTDKGSGQPEAPATPVTSLALQLKRLHLPQSALATSVSECRRVLFLYDPDEAANKDSEVVYCLAINGLKQLKQIDTTHCLIWDRWRSSVPCSRSTSTSSSAASCFACSSPWHTISCSSWRTRSSSDSSLPRALQSTQLGACWRPRPSPGHSLILSYYQTTCASTANMCTRTTCARCSYACCPIMRRPILCTRSPNGQPGQQCLGGEHISPSLSVELARR